jgi:hypothetical protein
MDTWHNNSAVIALLLSLDSIKVNSAHLLKKHYNLQKVFWE